MKAPEPRVLVAVTLGAIAVGGAAALADRHIAADVAWAVGVAVMLVPLAWDVARRLARRDVGVDAIALVSMAGALALGEYLAGAVIALMLAGGNALEAAAQRRARRELKALLDRAPRIAHVRRGPMVAEVPVDDVRVGDVVVVRAGEVVPVDGVVASREGILDESTLTGESLPVVVRAGGPVRSGSANAGEAFELRALRTAAESSYAGLVELVRRAEREQAPFVRMADRYAAVFLPVTAVVAAAAWAVSGDPVRALAVFVVATPCPLILAAPVALLSGVSRAARIGVIVKGAAPIERLGQARTVLFDKTGTVTLGAPGIERVVQLDGIEPREILRLAASADQLSAHPLAEALVHAAEERGLRLAFPADPIEELGRGLEATVDRRRVGVGSAGWLARRGFVPLVAETQAVQEAEAAGKAVVHVGVEGHVVGAVVMADRPRDDTRGLVARLRALGIRRVALVTGDRAPIGAAIGAALGVDRVYAEQTPEDKLEVVRAMQQSPELAPVVMVGDGINDAPALALADVGIALGTAGATVSSETADAVIVVDRVERVADAVAIGRRSLSIARQSVIAGMGLSFVAMGFAAAGFIPPLFGALLQEVVDVAVILNALRALR